MNNSDFYINVIKRALAIRMRGMTPYLYFKNNGYVDKIFEHITVHEDFYFPIPDAHTFRGAQAPYPEEFSNIMLIAEEHVIALAYKIVYLEYYAYYIFCDLDLYDKYND